MKALLLAIVAALLAGCAADQHAASTNGSSPRPQTSPASANQAESPKSDRTAGSNTALSADTGDHPVEFTSLGVTPDNQSVAYRIKVNTAKPIEELHLTLKELDSAGKVVDNTTIVWQNIVKSTQQPIESGKTYEDKSTLDPGTAKAECSLKEVVFKDGTTWSPR